MQGREKPQPASRGEHREGQAGLWAGVDPQSDALGSDLLDQGSLKPARPLLAAQLMAELLPRVAGSAEILTAGGATSSLAHCFGVIRLQQFC